MEKPLVGAMMSLTNLFLANVPERAVRLKSAEALPDTAATTPVN